MADFLLRTPNTLAEGTDTADIFVIQSAVSSSVYGNGGADLITATIQAGAPNISANRSIFQAGEGDDTISFIELSTVTDTTIRGGGGADSIVLSGTTIQQASEITGGGGLDTINLIAINATNASINGGQGADRIFATAGTDAFLSSLIGGGGDDDKLTISANLTNSTIAGGGGADSISATIAVGGTNLIQGDEIGADYYGNDTINIAGGSVTTASTIQGAGGADLLNVSSNLNTGAVVGGNYGRDTINVTGMLVTASVNGGAGADSITIGQFSGTSTVNGGGGLDYIAVSAASGGAAGSYVFGGDDADDINLRFAVTTGAATRVGYSDFTESDLGSTDRISSTQAQSGASVGSGGAMNIHQDVLSSYVLQAGGNNNFAIASGVVTFTATFSQNLTARVTELDSVLNQGAAVVFNDNSGMYLFVQGGVKDGSASDDLLVQYQFSGGTTLARAWVTAVGNSGFQVG